MVSWLDIIGCNSWSCACKSEGRKETQNCDHCPLHNSIEENFCLWLIIPIHFFLLVLPSFLTNSFCTVGWGFRGSAEGSTTSTEGYGYTSGSLWRCWQWCSKLISIFPQCRYISLSDCWATGWRDTLLQDVLLWKETEGHAIHSLPAWSMEPHEDEICHGDGSLVFMGQKIL